MSNQEEVFVQSSSQNEEVNRFDMVVGALEEIILEQNFEQLINNFCKEHANVFEDTEENKLVYSDIYKKYTTAVESYLNKRLGERLPSWFSMEKFLQSVQTRGEQEVNTDVFELLACDFPGFKDLMLNYKRGSPFGTDNDILDVKRIK